MPDEPEYPGKGPTYDMMNMENNTSNRDTRERRNMFYIEDKQMNRALCKLFLSPNNLQRRNNGKLKHEVQGYE